MIDERLARAVLEQGHRSPATPRAWRWFLLGVGQGVVIGLALALALGWTP